jgi:ribonuclease III
LPRLNPLRRRWNRLLDFGGRNDRRDFVVPDLNAFQDRLGYGFRDAALLQLALTHPSLAHEQGAAVQHNQRLEFLGDAVLGLVLTSELYEKFPKVDEGPLTKARAHMVNRSTLAERARSLNVGEVLIMSRGEETTGGRDRDSALADAFEAIIGAIFLDGGLEAARQFVFRCFDDALGEIRELPNIENPKGELQELLQAQSPEAPQYELVLVTGPDHNRTFECVVTHGGVELGRGHGKSKKAAESDAAMAALNTLRGQPSADSPSIKPLGSEHN